MVEEYVYKGQENREREKLILQLSLILTAIENNRLRIRKLVNPF